MREWGREMSRSGKHSRELDSGRGEGRLVSLSRGPDVTATDADLENPGCFCSVGFSALMRRRTGIKCAPLLPLPDTPLSAQTSLRPFFVTPGGKEGGSRLNPKELRF